MGSLSAKERALSCSLGCKQHVKTPDDGMNVFWYLILEIALMPVALALTLILLPFWRWVEASLAVEAIGHSGPATWGYLAVYAVLALVATLAVCLWSRRQGAPARVLGWSCSQSGPVHTRVAAALADLC